MPPKLTVEGKRNVAVARTDRVPYIRQISPFCIFLCFIFIYFFHFSTEPSALFFIFRPSDIRQISLFYFILFYFFSFFHPLDSPSYFVFFIFYFFRPLDSTDPSALYYYYYFFWFLSRQISPFFFLCIIFFSFSFLLSFFLFKFLVPDIV